MGWLAQLGSPRRQQQNEVYGNKGRSIEDPAHGKLDYSRKIVAHTHTVCVLGTTSTTSK